MYEYLHSATGDPLLPLWRLYKQGHDAACEVVKVPGGFEARVIQDGHFLFSHQFADSSDVIKWAFDKRVQYRRLGWCQTTVMRRDPQFDA